MFKTGRLVAAIVMLSICWVLKTSGQTSAPPDRKDPESIFSDFVLARKTKDIEKIKSLISKGSLERFTRISVKQGVSVDTLLLGNAGLKVVPPTRKSFIGELTAEIEVQNTVNGSWEKIPFVLENGGWKLALDVMARGFDDLADKLQAMVDEEPETKDDVEADERVVIVGPPRERDEPVQVATAIRGELIETQTEDTAEIEPAIVTDYNGDFAFSDIVEKLKVVSETRELSVLKASMSKRSVKGLKDIAKDQGMSLTGFLNARETEVPPYLVGETPKGRILKVQKNRIHYELQNRFDGKWLPFITIKENGVWKTAPFELMDEVLREMEDIFGN